MDQEPTSTATPSSPSCCTSTPTSVDFQALQDDLLDLVLRRLIGPDFERFGAVCRTFNRVKQTNDYTPDATGFPWIIAVTTYYEGSQKRVFRPVPSSSPYKLDNLIPAMQIHDHENFSHCHGSSLGWFILSPQRFDLESYKILLLNPFSGEHFRLPDCKESFKGRFKVVLSSSPSPDSTIVASMSNKYKHLKFARLGATKWSVVGMPEGVLEDFIFYKSQDLYAITKDGSLFMYHFEHLNSANSAEQPRVDYMRGVANLRFFPFDESLSSSINSYYLAEMDGDLLLVTELRKRGSSNTPNLFRVFKLGKTKRSNRPRWIELHSLDGGALFIDQNSCMFVSGICHNWMRNCIYFICRISGGIGVFSLEERAVVHFITEIKSSPRFTPLCWMGPNSV